jgi:hypothetical protein
MMGEAKLKMSSDKLRAPGGVQAACFQRGDVYAWRALPWLTPQGGGGGLCAFGPFAAVGVATAEIAKNLHIETKILAAAPKAATAAARAQAATPTPGEGARAVHKRPQTK